MTTMFIEKINIKDLEETIANSTPLLAIVGAGDLAVEKLRAARVELAGRAASFDPKAAREHAQATIAGRVEALQAELMSAPERIQALPEKAQEWPAKAQSLFADVLSTAFSTYGELAGRGKQRVTQVRGEMPAGVEADVEVKPVSRPATSTARKTTSAKTTSTAKPVAKSTATKKTATKKTATKRTTARKTTTAAAAKKSAVKKTTVPATKAADTHS